MNVAFVIPTLELGGAERVVSLMANHWAKAGWKISVITFAAAKSPPFYPLDGRIRHIPLGVAGDSPTLMDALTNNLQRLISVRKAIARTGADVVISFMTTTNVLTLLATRFMAIPVVVSERTLPSSALDRPVWRALRRLAYCFSSLLVVQSDEARSYFWNSLKQHVRVIPNPVREHSGEAGVGCAGIRKPFVVAVGRLESVKRFDHLLEAFARAGKVFPEWCLVILGDGSLRTDLRDLARKLAIADRVVFAGPVNDPGSYLKDAELFVLSSDYEGFPNSLLEAMACGLPVVSYACPGGVREIVRNGVDGVLVESGNVRALSEAVASLMADAEMRANLGREAVRVCERFALHRIMRIWEGELARIVSRRTSHAR